MTTQRHEILGVIVIPWGIQKFDLCYAVYTPLPGEVVDEPHSYYAVDWLGNEGSLGSDICYRKAPMP